MKNRGRNYKRANDAVKRLKKVGFYEKDFECRVVNVSRNHPNYFTAICRNGKDGEWYNCCIAYESAYMYPNGDFPIRHKRKRKEYQLFNIIMKGSI